jgi:hypothetical protein
MSKKKKKRGSGGVTTDELLQLEMPALTHVIVEFSPADCEVHVRELLARLDGPSYDKYVKTLVDVALTGTRCSDDYYMAVREYFPHVPRDSDVLGRLCAIAMKMVVDRLAANKEEIQMLFEMQRMCDELLDKRSGDSKRSGENDGGEPR